MAGLGGEVMADSLLNRKACKEFTLRWARDKRLGWKPTRVSKQFLDDLNTKIEMTIQKAVNRHRSVGKTIIDLF